MQPIFITGIGTGIGKTVVSAIVTQALHADYWKPIQAGYDDGTDNLIVSGLINNPVSKIHEEVYKLKLAASPHIAAREEGITIVPDKISERYSAIRDQQSEIKHQSSAISHQSSVINHQSSVIIIEGAGGLLVPLNSKEFIIDLIKQLDAKVILVSRNYLGSINHSLLTAQVCKANNLQVLGWIFNDQYLDYEEEIINWSGYVKIASIPFEKNITGFFVQQQANKIKESLLALL